MYRELAGVADRTALQSLRPVGGRSSPCDLKAGTVRCIARSASWRRLGPPESISLGRPDCTSSGLIFTAARSPNPHLPARFHGNEDRQELVTMEARASAHRHR